MNKRFVQTTVFALVICAIWSCSSGSESKEDVLEGNDFLVTIKTDLGEMKAILYDETPKHKENFLKLAREGFYDSLLFHRVMKGFMIQGGDPDSKNAEPGQRLGSGSPGYTVEAEFVPKYFHAKGEIASARLPDQANPLKASSGSQFFIVQGQVFTVEQLEQFNQEYIFNAYRHLMQNMPEHELCKEYQETLANNPQDNAAIQSKVESTLDRLAEATGMPVKLSDEQIEKYTTVGGYPPLDNQYTVYGRVIAGLEVMDMITEREVDPANRPLEDIRMYVTIEEMSRKEIAEKYGNPYM